MKHWLVRENKVSIMKDFKERLTHLPHIGMRKVKSVLAVFVGFWVWQLIRLVVPGLELHPIYIYIYGVIEMRETSEKTVDFGKLRIKATAVALVIGLPVLMLSDFLQSLTQLYWLQVGIELTFLLLGSLVVLCAAELVGCKNFCGLAAAILIILLISHSINEPLLYAVLRSAQTIIGVSVAWLINVKLFPYHGKQETA